LAEVRGVFRCTKALLDLVGRAGLANPARFAGPISLDTAGQPRLDTAIQTAAANRDQDRYVMITFPTSQIQNPVLPRRPSIRPGRRSCKYAFAMSTSPSIFLAYRRFPHLWRTNHAPQRRQPTLSSASVALTHLRRAQTSIALGARGATACHFPRVPSLKAFGRRPRCKPHRCDRPASETLNTNGLMRRSIGAGGRPAVPSAFWPQPPLTRSCPAVQRACSAVLRPLSMIAS
jgi:hypothetical protein